MYKSTLIFTLLIGIAHSGRRPVRPPAGIPAIASSAGSSKSSNPYVDIIFVLDTSGSIGRKNFKIMLDKCKEIVDDHNVGIDATLFGLDLFSTAAETIIRIDDYITAQSVKNAIGNVGYKGGSTATHLALNRLVDDSFTFANGHVSYARKIAIVMTDGFSNDREATKAAAKRAKDSGITIKTIGIGGNINWQEIISITAGKKNEEAFKVPSFKALRRFDIGRLNI